MKYCEANVNFTVPWTNEGISKCFIGTIVSGLLCLVTLPFGYLNIRLYWRYGSSMDPADISKSCFGRLQSLFMWTLFFEGILHFILQAEYILPATGDHVCGYMILQVTTAIFCWPIVWGIWYCETTRLLPSIPTRGHGLLLLIVWAIAFIGENLSFISIESPSWWFKLQTNTQKCEFGLWIVRYFCTFMLFVLGFFAPALPRRHSNVHRVLAEGEENGSGTNANNSERRPARRQRSTWSNLWSKLKLMFPYVWPKGHYGLQLRVLFCVLCLVAGRFVNIYVPLYYKYIVDSLTIRKSSGNVNLTDPYPWYIFKLKPSDLSILGENQLEFRWDFILVYVALRFLQGIGAGGSGFLGNMRTMVWIRVNQYTEREISLRLFGHLHGLSLRWHLAKKTGEVLRVMARGTTSINSVLNYVVFQILPTFFDIGIGVVYFASVFNLWFGLIVLVTMVLYIAATIVITEWRTKFRRQMNLLDNERNAKAVDSLLNFETVKYYGAEEFEVNRYRDAILSYQHLDFLSQMSLALLSIAQNVVINLGFLAGALLCAWYVVQSNQDSTMHQYTVGDYVLFATYILQLYGPLNWFGTYYRMIQQQFVDMENMFELLEVEKEVADAEDAVAIQVEEGEVEFRDVHFSYNPEAPILKGVSFKVPAGHTVALVGHSGSGKSTCVRLLFRFYDVQKGKILIDGQDIRSVKQSSLRQNIGVVPQDTVLFNSDIRYNIRYGRQEAEDAEIEAAAAAADIHDRITNFTDGYDTVVGERGLKLSGGEKQRVAIARTLLKAPRVVLLDEATSALDTKTERNIQASLDRVCQGRTTLVVAHRLSTVIGADEILVMKDGLIVERGTHDALLLMDGLYHEMWEQHLSAEAESAGSKKEE